MLVNFNLNNHFKQPSISINTAEKTPVLEKIAISIQHMVNDWQIQGYLNGQQKIIPVYQVVRFYTVNKYVVCESTDGTYRIRKRIYELRDSLPQTEFIQISSSEIVSIISISSLSLTKTGAYQVNLTNGETTYTSRRYMQKLKKEFLK